MCLKSETQYEESQSLTSSLASGGSGSSYDLGGNHKMSICKSDVNLLGGHPEMIKLIIFENVGLPASRPAKEQ